MSKRFERREEAKAEGEEAKETGTAEDLDRFSRRTVKVTKEHNEECRRLLTLMGIPVVIVSCVFYLTIHSLYMNLRHRRKQKLNVQNSHEEAK